MGNGSRKQITFDLQQEALKKHYPHKAAITNPQFYKKAYSDIQRFMVKNGFEHRQYSVYISIGRMTNLDIMGLMEQLAQQMPWLHLCVNEIDVTNIGAQHGLKQTLETATRELDFDLEEPAERGMQSQAQGKQDDFDLPDIPLPRKNTKKRRNDMER